MNHPLQGIRVLDLTRLLPSGVATQMLSDLGAEVIKIEDPNGGDYARWMGPTIDDSSVFFRMNNRNKRSLILNLKSDEGASVLKQLVKQADVLVESFRPGVMKKFGCDYESLSIENPKLIYCAISGWGATGPYAPFANHDINYVSLAGIIGAMQTPQVLGGQVADLGGAYVAVAGITSALFRRERTGEGAFVDVGLSEAALPFSLYNWTEAESLGFPAGDGVLSGGLACYRVYMTQEGRAVALGALEEKFWLNFCTAINRPDLVEYHQQIDQQGYLRRELEELFAQKTAPEWEALLANADCCFTLVKTPAEIGNDPHYVARGMLGKFDDGTTWMRSPIRLSNSEPAIENHVPHYGEHTHAILTEMGFSEADIQRLIDQKVVK